MLKKYKGKGKVLFGLALVASSVAIGVGSYILTPSLTADGDVDLFIYSAEEMELSEDIKVRPYVDWHSQDYLERDTKAKEEYSDFLEDYFRKLDEEALPEVEPIIMESPSTEVSVEPTGGDDVLTPSKGVVYYQGHKETYYNLPMDGVVAIMRSMGFSEEEYPYAVREDGVKTLGGYVIVAANLNVHPRGSFVESSLGLAIVCDTGGFADIDMYQLDIATAW